MDDREKAAAPRWGRNHPGAKSLAEGYTTGKIVRKNVIGVDICNKKTKPVEITKIDIGEQFLDVETNGFGLVWETDLNSPDRSDHVPWTSLFYLFRQTNARSL